MRGRIVTDQERYIIRGVTDNKPWALELFEQYQTRRLGTNPLAEGAHSWPDWTATQTRTQPPDHPLHGWRMWGLIDTLQGTRLAAPFLVAIHREHPGLPGVTWQPGTNTNTNRHCDKRWDRTPNHPTTACRCGIRVMQSLTALRAFADFAQSQEPDAGPLIAYAQVDAWGHIAPAARDDFRHTIRVEHATISGPLHLHPDHAKDAATLARHYGVEVQLTTSLPGADAAALADLAPPCDHYGPHGAAGLLLVDQGKALLQLRSHGVQVPGTWSIPGGALQRGETPEQGALREANEEAGINSDDVRVTAGWAHECRCGWTYTTLIATPIRTLTLAGNWESRALQWVPLERVATLPLHPAFRDAWPQLRALGVVF